MSHYHSVASPVSWDRKLQFSVTQLQSSDSKISIEKYQGLSLRILILQAYKDDLKFTHTVHLSA